MIQPTKKGTTSLGKKLPQNDREAQKRKPKKSIMENSINIEASLQPRLSYASIDQSDLRPSSVLQLAKSYKQDVPGRLGSIVNSISTDLGPTLFERSESCHVSALVSSPAQLRSTIK